MVAFGLAKLGRLRMLKNSVRNWTVPCSQIAACRPWIDGEIDVIKPEVIVCLGATAAQALLGRQFKVSTQRGVWIESPLAPFVMATVHPSSLLRAPDDETRRREMQRLIADLKRVHEALKKHKAA